MTQLLEPAIRLHTPLSEPNLAAYRDLLVIASLVLGYPDDSLCQERGQIAEALSALPSSRPRDLLVEFCDWWGAADPDQLRRDYVATFDTRRRSALYVTYLTYGDSRTRGQAIHEIKALYRQAGFEPAAEELPDYLPTVCQFVALAPSELGLAALSYARSAVQSIHEALVAKPSPYAGVLAAISSIIEKGARS
ncbi:MAG: nitrate reductase molybdenum cofactor assembly chaperone [Propionibacteriaceae bacterium]|jgi:nitrate reductase delta subunit|nr:nitrate reductase molybdenum cofactor assembly chaperone [Propionibacteriaceae bacterium]